MNIILDFFLLFSHSHPSLLPFLAFCSVRSLPFPCLPLLSAPFDPLLSLASPWLLFRSIPCLPSSLPLPFVPFDPLPSLAFPSLAFFPFSSLPFPSLPFPCLALNKLYLLTIQIARMVAGISMEFMIKKLKNLFPPSNTEPKETP